MSLSCERSDHIFQILKWPNLHNVDAYDKSPGIGFRTGFPGQYRGLIRVISTFGGRVNITSRFGLEYSLFASEGVDALEVYRIGVHG